jgi:subtilase family serine protease
MKRQLEVRPVVLSYLLTVGALLWFGLTAANAADSGRTVLAGHVPPEVSRLVPKSRLAGDHVLALAIGLPLRNQDALNQLIGQLYDPASTNYHRFLSNQEFTARFGPTAQDYETVKQFVRANGLRVAKTYPNRLILDVQGDAAHIEQAFQTTLRTYRHPSEPRNFFAPDTEPSVPVGVPVNDMFGLSDFSRPRPMVHAAAERGSGPLNYNGSGSSGAYQGRDFRNAYIPGSNLNGSGQVVALFELDGYYTNDISAYEANCGYTNVPLQNVYVGITNGTPPGYSGVANAVAEVSLDIEMVVSMAPGLANVLVYEGNNPYDVYNQIVTDNAAKQISSSWFFGVGPSHRWHGGGTTLDSLFQTMIAQGQALFQASGDSDAWTGSQAFSLTSGPIPMDSPYLTCVGGTSLTMNGSGASWSSETVWNYASFGGADANVGSGGGVSTYYGIPAWQTNVSMAANSGSTVNRNLPDVALTADYIAVVHDNGTSDIEAGTSCAAPLWAGFCALANQFDAATNGTTLGFVNPALYAIGGSSAAARSLHDITTGSNIGTHTAGLYNAVPGYDLATGFGTPAGTNLITALAWPPPQFTAQPVGRTVTNGVSVTLAAAASSSTPEVYFWQCNGTNLAAGSNISGVGTNTLAISAATTNNSGNYQLVVSNFTGFATSRVAVLNVGFPPSVSVSPSSLTLLAGSNAVFTATAGTRTAPISQAPASPAPTAAC